MSRCTTVLVQCRLLLLNLIYLYKYCLSNFVQKFFFLFFLVIFQRQNNPKSNVGFTETSNGSCSRCATHRCNRKQSENPKNSAVTGKPRETGPAVPKFADAVRAADNSHVPAVSVVVEVLCRRPNAGTVERAAVGLEEVYGDRASRRRGCAGVEVWTR